jgi:hypothetical protein
VLFSRDQLHYCRPYSDVMKKVYILKATQAERQSAVDGFVRCLVPYSGVGMHPLFTHTVAPLDSDDKPAPGPDPLMVMAGLAPAPAPAAAPAAAPAKAKAAVAVKPYALTCHPPLSTALCS